MSLIYNKIMVTGGQGFIGKLLVAELMKGNVNVDVFDIVDGNDIRNFNQLKNFKNIDVVCHLAAIKSIPFSFEKPRETYEVNVNGTLNALELCRIYDAEIIFPSTAYVYGHPKYLPIDEKHPMRPTNPYARSKLLGEKLCKGYFEDYGMKCIILRIFNVYGENMSTDSIISLILKQVIQKKRIVVRDLNPRKDFVHVKDVINAYLKSINYNTTDFEIFNIGYGKSYSVKDAIDMLVAKIGENIEVKTLSERRKSEIPDIVADISKARKLLKWKPEIEFESGLYETYLHMKSDKKI